MMTTMMMIVMNSFIILSFNADLLNLQWDLQIIVCFPQIQTVFSMLIQHFYLIFKSIITESILLRLSNPERYITKGSNLSVKSQLHLMVQYALNQTIQSII